MNKKNILLLFFQFGIIFSSYPLHANKGQPKHTTYLLYCYYETSKSAINLSYFIENGLTDDSNIQYCFIINGETLSVSIPEKPNVQVIKRPNIGYDFGGWTEALNKLNIYEKMRENDRLILMNSTVRGPLVKKRSPFVKKNDVLSWIDQLNIMITDKVKLAGVSINCNRSSQVGVKSLLAITPYSELKDQFGPLLPESNPHILPHVQSYLMVTDKIGLDIGLRFHIFDGKQYHKTELVNRKEIGFSTAILASGFNIDCLLTHYKGVNYRKLDEFKNLNTDNNTFGDILYKGAYFGGTIDPYEAVFVKTNRNLDLSLPEPSNLKYFGKKMILILIFLSLFFLFKKIKLDKFFKVKIKSG